MSRNRTLEQARDRLDAQLAAHPEDPRLLQMRAKAAERLGAHEEAASFWQRAARVLRAADDRSSEANAWLEAACAYARAGQRSKARNFFQRAVANAELLGDEVTTARAREEHAKHLVAIGEDTEARALLERILAPLGAQKAWDDLAWAHGELARILEVDAPKDALAHARCAVEAAAKGKDRSNFGERLSGLARMHLAAGHLAKAASYQEKALPYLKSQGQHKQLLEAYDLLVMVARSEDDQGAAERFLVEAIMLADAIRDLPNQARLRQELGQVVRRRDRRRARTLLEQAVERFHRSGDPHGAANVYGELGELLADADPEGSAKAFRRSADFFEMVGDSERAALMADRCGQVEAGTAS